MGAQSGSGSDGVAEEGDLITGIDTGSGVVDVVTFADLDDALEQTPPGTTVELQVERDGEPTSLPDRDRRRRCRRQRPRCVPQR